MEGSTSINVLTISFLDSVRHMFPTGSSMKISIIQVEKGLQILHAVPSRHIVENKISRKRE